MYLDDFNIKFYSVIGGEIITYTPGPEALSTGFTLPPDATFTPPPEKKEGFRLIIENNGWKYMELSVEDIRADRLVTFKAWEPGFLNQPFIYEGHVFPNDAKFKEMMNSSIGAMSAWNRLPKLWVTATQEIITPITKTFLNGLGETAYINYENNVGTAVLILQKIQTATTKEELLAIKFPKIETVESLYEKLHPETCKPKEEEGEPPIAIPQPLPEEPLEVEEEKKEEKEPEDLDGELDGDLDEKTDEEIPEVPVVEEEEEEGLEDLDEKVEEEDPKEIIIEEEEGEEEEPKEVVIEEEEVLEPSPDEEVELGTEDETFEPVPPKEAEGIEEEDEIKFDEDGQPIEPEPEVSESIYPADGERERIEIKLK